QSALDAVQKATFRGLNYYPYNPAYRLTAKVNINVEPITYEYDLEGDGHTIVRQFGQVTFDLPTGIGTLGLFWIQGYGGGLFLPFGDATNKHATYGAGRYLYDTIKGADLGAGGLQLDEIVLDFNYAYHPSCYYNPRWVCPLAPPQNRLAFPIEAGERLMDDQP
ncbi:MAG TPA: DUF1684 domain-containing protein, partial [Phototrophicaceae bacterium]|nr:DUF1684 domain-containing protein [Phototrophicaceae bacterium]